MITESMTDQQGFPFVERQELDGFEEPEVTKGHEMVQSGSNTKDAADSEGYTMGDELIEDGGM